ncbi:MAG: DegT/DnrJ/EryC1/StrS family aminotransferase [Gammaproteobacteria bacterium]|nr:DegT/DnrJ/EryC1/StrS family aminotransferase [Gammaproteobacteria bacterium]
MNANTLQLALFGDVPAFEKPLHTNQPYSAAPQQFFNHVEQCFDRGWFTNDGPLVRELESRISRFLGVEHCVAVTNATLGLQLLMNALELRGEVIVPSFTFVATPHAVCNSGLHPVFCDIDPDSWNMDPGHCASLINEKTSAILSVHLFGRPCDTHRLQEIAQDHNLKLIYDAAHAFACSHTNKKIGGFGDAEVFSFHANKFFHTIEGGAITTNDGELAQRLRLDRNFGFVGIDNVESLGTNAKMSEVHAAMGLSNLDLLDDTLGRCRDVYQSYADGLRDIPGVTIRNYDAQGDSWNYQYVVAEIDEQLNGIPRDLMVDILCAENVIARRYFYPGCHRMAAYAAPRFQRCLPITEKVADRVIVLPGGAAMNAQSAREICSLIQYTVDHAAPILERVSKIDGAWRVTT